MNEVADYDFGISAVDSGYHRPQFDAIYLIIENGRVAIVDSGVNASVPRVLAALRAKNLAPEQVECVVLTHVHLDHAGGAGALMMQLPNARLVVHPRGAPHVVDPARLVAGATIVYGEEKMREAYGKIVPVPRERVIEAPHEFRLDLNGRELVFFDTPGHARHHLCILDTRSGHVFAGDTFGLSLRELDSDGRQFVFPTTTPVQFDPDALRRSVDLIAGLRPEAVYVTHYGRVEDISRLAADLHRLIDAHAQLALAVRDTGPDRHQRLKTGVMQLLVEEKQRQNWMLPREKVLEIFAGDIELNAQGLDVWLSTLE
ncbi:MAG TPA: MBL fold metallo-hydrolase [Burkholderiales bacterium]|nr:MBL fold metallo-hydrolase [Burkholderiales bacterium]